MKKIVLTGGPSVGKTTVIEILASRGYVVVPEAARIIIEEEKIKSSDALPWKDIGKFQHLVAKRQLDLETNVSGEIIFYDRGIVDGYAYCELANVSISELILNNVKGRYDAVFFLESLNKYVEDGVRSRTLEGAGKIHTKIKETYLKFGYSPISVPVLPPEQRVDFILNSIK